MKVIIDIPKEEYDIIKNYKSFMSWTEGLIKKGVAIPEGATNGDMIKAMFPQAKIVINELLGTNGTVFVQYGSEEYDEIVSYSLDWWNLPYKGVEE